jgi:dihydrofolate reductase
MKLALVAALSTNGVIGRDNQLPWRLPEDLAHFKRVTLNHPIVMGRKTFESIGRPLPKRRNIVVTRGEGAAPAGVEVARSLEAALDLVRDEDVVMVIGGGEIFRQTIDRAWRLYLTLVDAEIAGDVFFPPYDAAAWREVERRPGSPPPGGPAYTFVTLERVAG